MKAAAWGASALCAGSFKTVVDRVVPIPIPASEMPPMLPKMPASVLASTGAQAPIRYHVIYYLLNTALYKDLNAFLFKYIMAAL